MITKAGIPAAAAPLARDADEAVALAAQFGYPVVLKIASPDIAHKSEVGWGPAWAWKTTTRCARALPR